MCEQVHTDLNPNLTTSILDAYIGWKRATLTPQPQQWPQHVNRIEVGHLNGPLQPQQKALCVVLLWALPIPHTFLSVGAP
jgi:hypothetical protein